MKGEKRLIKTTRKGAKDNRIKLVWSKYYKYLIDDKEYYIKEKAYATYCDGWIDSEKITKQTYRRAIKRKNECIEIDIRKDNKEISTSAIVLIFKEKYEIEEKIIIDLMIRAKKRIERIKKDSKISKEVENKLLIKMLEDFIILTKEGR